MADRYRKKPVEVAAIRWTGGDYKTLNNFCGKNWSRADAVDCEPHDEEQVVVWNTKEYQWLNVPVGHWVIRGVAGELYPCDPAVFEATYEPVEESR
jgi:hypothetical protein